MEPAMMWRSALLVVSGCSFSVGGGGVQPDDAAIDTKPPIDASSDAAIDAVMIDAPPPLLCPLNYISINGSVTKYRPIYTLGSYWTHEASCEADTPTKITHGAVIDSLDEAADIRAYLIAQAPVYKTFGVGAVQSSTATTVGGGWIDFRDRVLDPQLWGVYENVQQPDDVAFNGSASFENHEQNVALFDIEATGTHPYLRDGAGIGSNYVFLCECDGFTVGTLALKYLADDPNNPN